MEIQDQFFNAIQQTPTIYSTTTVPDPLPTHNIFYNDRNSAANSTSIINDNHNNDIDEENEKNVYTTIKLTKPAKTSISTTTTVNKKKKTPIEDTNEYPLIPAPGEYEYEDSSIGMSNITIASLLLIFIFIISFIIFILYIIIKNRIYKKKLKKLKRDYKNLENMKNQESSKIPEKYNNSNDDSNKTLIIENDNTMNIKQIQDFLHISKNVNYNDSRNDGNSTIYNNDEQENNNNNLEILNNDSIPSYHEFVNPYINIDRHQITSLDSTNQPPSYRSTDSINLNFSNPVNNHILLDYYYNNNNNNTENENNKQYIPYALPNYFLNNIPPQIFGVPPNDNNCNYVPVYIPVNALPPLGVVQQSSNSNSPRQLLVRGKTQQQILNDIKNNDIKEKPFDEIEEKIGKTPVDAIPFDRVQPEPELRQHHHRHRSNHSNH